MDCVVWGFVVERVEVERYRMWKRRDRGFFGVGLCE